MLDTESHTLTVLLMGSSGLLGSHLKIALEQNGLSVTGLSANKVADIKVDASRKTALFASLSGKRFDVIVNLIGLTSVETCEDYPDLAHRTNTLPAENAASWVMEVSPATHLVQISTDHVYDGKGPHSESDTSMVNTYSLTKYAGELGAKLVPSSILRTNFVGKSTVYGRVSLTDWIFDSLKNEEHIEVLDDVMFSPVSIDTLCSVIFDVIRKRPVGTFNLGSSDGMSKADFDFQFADCLGLETKFMTRIEASGARFLRARRPLDMRMDSSKLEECLGIKLPTLDEEIRMVAMQYE